ncbi:MAG: four helix bundle protein [Dysgonamonadaceae bacterium]|jgi:four helix bundle protein|nr:four helix bundle protein [Dysgonamonadaceae bacterium]
MEKGITIKKSYEFAIRIVNLYKVLCQREEYVLSKQLLRSGTAIGALMYESEHAQSRADFINKINVALKEANESSYWILLLKDTEYITAIEYNSIMKDCKELIKLTASIVKTTKNKSNIKN